MTRVNTDEWRKWLWQQTVMSSVPSMWDWVNQQWPVTYWCPSDAINNQTFLNLKKKKLIRMLFLCLSDDDVIVYICCFHSFPIINNKKHCIVKFWNCWRTNKCCKTEDCKTKLRGGVHIWRVRLINNCQGFLLSHQQYLVWFFFAAKHKKTKLELLPDITCTRDIMCSAPVPHSKFHTFGYCIS